jgi:hypothetical protein
MNTKLNAVAGAAILMALAVPSVAAAQASYLPLRSQAWGHMEPANVRAGDLASAYAPKHQRGRYVEIPSRQSVPADPGMTVGFPANGGGG